MLCRLYSSTPTQRIADQLGRTASSVYNQAFGMGLRKDDEYLGTAGRLRAGTCAGEAYRFRKGNVPHNAGKKGWSGGGQSILTRFKPGQLPQQTLPLGTLRMTKDGLLERKVSDSGAKRQQWRPVQQLVWIKHHGAIPTGHVVAFREGQHSVELEQITIERLELLSRADLMKRNSVHTRYPKEIVRLIQLRGALNRQIRKRERNEEQNSRST